ncbi:hypothetical protein QP866_00525 [Corynebacterium imitans]|uniref:hypothetical protein n=1 Tax=Corynebacterium imitans TaxID=156978 RepID=UPI00254D8264|nr:hypothetical protein [Corynebacterium imitans]MDK8305380.1 hypothetical protein [Corynebacterium imitans]MDK8636319.1 hypothetical protein [Corynebacterium imitans]MDK8771517.1 hypothetical protein [Corynebacterium imitans]
MQNANLKKRIMAALISGVLATGTTAVIAPEASAADQMIVEAYQRLDEASLRQFEIEQGKLAKRYPKWTQSVQVLSTKQGPGWCIDWGIDSSWNNPDGFEVRKLTGQSGRFGQGYAIDESIRIAAITLTKSMLNDYKQWEKTSSSSLEQDIRKKNRYLQALLGNNPSELNGVRELIHDRDLIKFENLTGFSITRVQNPSDGVNYRLVPNQTKLAEMKKKIGPNEYVTVLVPKNYNWNMNKRKEWTFQRLITIYQPGLDLSWQPKPDYDFSTTVVETPKETHTEITTMPEHVTTVTEPGKPVTKTIVTEEPTTVTRTSTLPASTAVTTVTEPDRVITTTKTHPAKTTEVVRTENGTPVTETKTITPAPEIVTETKKGETKTVTSTVTDTTVTETVPGEKKTVTQVETPEVTTTRTVPAGETTVTKTVEGEPTTVTVNKDSKYYTEKVYESIKEVYEYYQFAGFTKEEKSKVIELDKRISGSWSFRITEGSEYVIVERGEKDGQLIVTPRPGIDGEHKVTIVVTDDQGREHVYRLTINNTVNIDESINVKVNNFFYNINTGGEGDRFKVLKYNEGETWKKVKGGELVDVKDDGKGSLTVTPKDGVTSGEVIVTITDKQGNERENIITIENKDSKYDVTRTILNTSVGFVEYRGGDFKIIEGEDVLEIKPVEVNGEKVWKIIPKVEEGSARVVFTDKDGIEYTFTFEVVKDPNGGPQVVQHNINYTGNVEIERREDYRYEVVKGDHLLNEEQLNIEETTRETDGKKVWKITPNEDDLELKENGGTAIINIKDSDDRLVGIFTIYIERDVSGDVEKVTRERDVVDRSRVNVFLGDHKTNHFTVEPLDDAKLGNFFEEPEKYEGKEIKSDLALKFKPGAEGRFKVTEFVQKPIQEEIKDDKGNVTGYKTVGYDNVPITEYVYTVKPFEPSESTYTITADNEVDLQGKKLYVTEGGDLLESTPTDGESKFKLVPKADAEGKVVIENRTDDGFVFERYILNITPGRAASKDNVTEKTMTWSGVARINKEEGHTYKFVSAKDAKGNDIDGEKLVRVKEENGEFVVSGRAGKTGTVTIAVSDNRGVYATYKLTINEAEGARVYDYQISTNAEFRATLVEKSNQFVVIDGGEYLETPNNDGNQWTVKPKQSGVGKTATVEEWDQDGNVLNTYNLKIVQGATSGSRHLRDYLIVGQAKAYEPISEGNTFKVVQGADHVNTGKDDKGNFTLTPKSGTDNKTVVTEEYDKDGILVRTITSLIIPENLTSNGAFLGDNRDVAKIIRDEKTGQITVVFDKEGGDVAIAEGSDLVDQSRDGNNIILTPKQGADGTIIFIPVLDGSQNKSEVEVRINTSNNQGSGAGNVNVGSSDPKCIASLVGLASPLLLLIPLGILSQVHIPGLEGVRGQLNAAIKEANDRIQQGLGIYDRDRAQRAAGLQGAFAIENSQMIGIAAGGLGLITAGLLIGDAVLRACGQQEATSSYQLGKATDNETLMYGSSGKPAESEAAKPEDEKAAAEEK